MSALAETRTRRSRKSGATMNAPRRYVTRATEMNAYSPANHTGTRNVRLVGAANGARHMEIVLGEIERNEGAPPHAHPDLEQAAYILEGEAIANIDGVDHHVTAGDMCFFPPMVYHSIKVLSDKLRVLVVYAPPYGESPDKVVRRA
jgi:quercetin dioxygenase-like cupin family protein